MCLRVAVSSDSPITAKAPPAPEAIAARGTPPPQPSPQIVATDGELLSQFLSQEDRVALDRLIQRHSAMVWRVCRSTLRRPQDVEDAFQATFLLLVKNARSIKSSDSAAGWLYRVAYRTSLRARKQLAARREEALAVDPHAPSETAFPDLLAKQTTGVLVEELMRLPAKYQTPLVLRYLEGQSRRAIADQTDTTIAAVQGRLARGKQLLRRRLLRRGVSLAAAMGALGLGARGAAAAENAPAQVLAQTTTNSTALATGGSVAASAGVLNLFQEGVRAMLAISIGKPLASAAALAAAALLLMPPGEAGESPVGGVPTSGALQLDVDLEPHASAVVADQSAVELVQATPHAASDGVVLQADRIELQTQDDQLVQLQAHGEVVITPPKTPAPAVFVPGPPVPPADERERLARLLALQERLKALNQSLGKPSLPAGSPTSKRLVELSNRTNHAIGQIMGKRIAEQVAALENELAVLSPTASRRRESSEGSSAKPPPRPDSEAIRKRLTEMLSYIPGVRVDVGEENAGEVHASIAVPHSHIESVHRVKYPGQTDSASFTRAKLAVYESIREIAGPLIPQPDRTKNKFNQIHITVYTAVPENPIAESTASRRSDSPEEPPQAAKSIEDLKRVLSEAERARRVMRELTQSALKFQRQRCERLVNPVRAQDGQTTTWADLQDRALDEPIYKALLKRAMVEDAKARKLAVESERLLAEQVKQIDRPADELLDLSSVTERVAVLSQRAEARDADELDKQLAKQWWFRVRQAADVELSRSDFPFSDEERNTLRIASGGPRDIQQRKDAALRKYQEAMGLKPTGELNEATWNKLFGLSSLAKKSATPKKPTLPKPLSKPVADQPAPKKVAWRGITTAADAAKLRAIRDDLVFEDQGDVSVNGEPMVRVTEMVAPEVKAARHIEGQRIDAQAQIARLKAREVQLEALLSKMQHEVERTRERIQSTITSGDVQAYRDALRTLQRDEGKLKLLIEAAKRDDQLAGSRLKPLPTVDGVALMPPIADGPGIVYKERNDAYGWSVHQLQERLNELLDPSPRLRSDGDYGPLTEAAVKRFQGLKGLPASGFADEATRRALGFTHPRRIVLLPNTDDENSAYADVGRKYGWSVAQLQERLNELLDLSPPLEVDDDYGPLTEYAVRRFQESIGLPATGFADQATRKELGFVRPSEKSRAIEPIKIDKKPNEPQAAYQYGPDSKMKQGQWNCLHRPTALNPVGWATVAQLQEGEHAPIKLPDDARPRPHVKFLGMEDRAPQFEIVDPGHEQHGQTWDGATPRRIRDTPVECRVIEGPRSDATTLLVIRGVPVGAEGEFEPLEDLPTVDQAKALLQTQPTQASRRRESSEDNAARLPGPHGPLHVVGTYQGADGAPTTVEVSPTDEPITLVLTSYYWVDWRLKLAEGAKLARVIIAGYNNQHVEHLRKALPEGVPLEVFTYFNEDDNPNRQGRYFWAYKQTSQEYHKLVKHLKELTGRGVATFTGAYGADRFRVPATPSGDKQAAASPVVAAPVAETAEQGDRRTATRAPGRIDYTDGRADGKKSLGGSGHLIRYELPEGAVGVKSLRIHGSRYGTKTAPREDFDISFLSEDRSEILDLRRGAYGLFRRGEEKWTNVRFKDPVVDLPKTFWVAIDFNPGRTKGVYLSYDTSTGGERSMTGLAQQEPGEHRPVDFDGDWMVSPVLVRGDAVSLSRPGQRDPSDAPTL